RNGRAISTSPAATRTSCAPINASSLCPANVAWIFSWKLIGTRFYWHTTCDLALRMKSRFAVLLVVVSLALACRNDKNLKRGQQNYDVVQEGSAAGVTSTISG